MNKAFSIRGMGITCKFCIDSFFTPYHFLLRSTTAVKESLLSKGNDAREEPSGTGTRQAFAMLEGVQGQAAKEILKEVDVVVCSCIGAGNDAFVRAIGGDQER